MEIKKLNVEIGKVESEMNKYEEQLVNCIRYKQFLDGLTEPEWLAREEKRKEEKRSERRKRREEASKAKVKSGGTGTAVGGSRVAADGSMLSARTRSALQTGNQTSRVSWRQRTDEEKETLTADGTTDGSGGMTSRGGTVDTEPFDDEDGGTDVDEEPMYFTQPQQLLDIFSQLEERNLFLIQNVQETEEAVDEMRTRYNDMVAEMDEKQAVLHSNIREMNAKIDKEREKTELLRVRKEIMGIVGDVKGVDAERVVDGLREQVKAVYRKCGFDADTQTDTLDVRQTRHILITDRLLTGPD